MRQLARGSGTPAAATTRTRPRAAVPHPRPRSPEQGADRRRLAVGPCAPSSLEPRDINILLFTTQIKHRLLTPSRNQSLKLKVTFCVRGVLSPLLSNIVLHALDCELEGRGHRFVRYADDCNVYVRSARAGHRVMASITLFISTRLKLNVNATKSAVAAGRERTFLGFSFTHGQRPKRRLADKTLVRFRARVRQLTRRVRGVSLRQMVKELAAYVRGWRAYFGFCETPTILPRLDKWIRRRLRAVVWKQWTRPGTRFRQLRKRGVNAKDAILTARSNRGPWRVTLTAALCWALPGAYFDSLGLSYLRMPDGSTGRTAVVRTRMPGGVGGATSRGVPLSRSAAMRGFGPRHSTRSAR
jgi:Group II intron, maturase-specific domain/Reverse transcriptase (RNA-dependent DNA polymerase)